MHTNRVADVDALMPDAQMVQSAIKTPYFFTFHNVSDERPACRTDASGQPLAPRWGPASGEGLADRALVAGHMET